jgi:uncharacterized protein YggE
VGTHPGATVTLNSVFFGLSPAREAEVATNASKLAMASAVSRARVMAEVGGACLGRLLHLESPPRENHYYSNSAMAGAGAEHKVLSVSGVSIAPSTAYDVEVLACFELVKGAAAGNNCAAHW